MPGFPWKTGFKFKKALPNATLEVIPFCGHIPQEENPEETARIILEFLEKH
jgi:pimeloyl-ACP methyl ester carboxylesterase